MIAMVWHELRRRLGRSLAMGFAVLVAAAGFTVLTSSSNASKLATTGQVQGKSLTSYDVLVRPKGARTPQETSGRLVQPGFLSGIFGGITTTQWQQILHMSGVSVAAPITVMTTIMHANVQVDVTKLISRTAPTTLRIDGTWHLPDARVAQQQPQFLYTTPNQVGAPWSGSKNPKLCQLPPILPNTPPGQVITKAPGVVLCQTVGPQTPAQALPWHWVPADHASAEIVVPLPQVLVAVDPVQESKLLGLASASSTGAVAKLARVTKASDGTAVAPVLFSARASGDTSLQVTSSVLGTAGNTLVASSSGGFTNVTGLSKLPTGKAQRNTITSTEALKVTQRLTSSYFPNVGYPGAVWQYWTASAPRLSGSGQDFTAGPVNNDLSTLWTDAPYSSQAPAGTDERGYRVLTLHQTAVPTEGANPVSVVAAGSFDPSKLAGLDQIAGQVLTGYATAPTTGADAASKAALGNKAVQASPNIAALVQPAPTMLTSLAQLPALMNNAASSGSQLVGPTGGGVISAIRVKVTGVHGVDAASRERVRLVAQRISAMGLDVDITVGSSPTQITLHQPAGTHGQPALVLHQYWVKLGVATTILKALDAKSLALFVLVLIVAGLCVANSAIASVRSRRTDLGVLACVGWTRAALFRLVVTELGVIALVAGVIAAGLSLALGAAFGTPVSPSRALLAVPASLVVTLVAGFVPAYLAASSDPMDAVRPAVTTSHRPRVTRTVLGLGRGNLARSRTRTVLAVLGLVVATAAFTLLLAISVGFQGAVVGSVLGDAVAIQTRTSDYAAAAATFALAGIGVGNLMYLNIRDRGPELATLRATGWTEHHLRRLLFTEGALIGAIGGVSGALLGLVAASALIGSLPLLVLLAALGTAVAAVLISLAATLLASTLLLRLPTTMLLTE